ncbi:MAG TPA: hypothetical protein VF613_09925 [Longimicrobium sp.]|jgi:hypothetical protein
MPLRTFQDSQGAPCSVWNVTPFAAQEGERRNAERRAATAAVYAGPERRAGKDRRVRTPGLMTPGLESGWLCFESGSEKRRLSPIPPGWDQAPDDELESLFRDARAVTRRTVILP